MHHVGVVLSGEDVAGAAHVGGELVNLVETTIDNLFAECSVAQITADKVVGFRLGMLMKFDVDAADPKSFSPQPLDEMAANESASTAN